MPVTGEDMAGRCTAYNGTDGLGAGCYCNGTAGHDTAYPGAAYFNSYTEGYGPAYHGTTPLTMVWPGMSPARTRRGAALRTMVQLGARHRRLHGRARHRDNNTAR